MNTTAEQLDLKTAPLHLLYPNPVYATRDGSNDTFFYEGRSRVVTRGRFLGDTGTVPLTLFYEGRSRLSRVEHKETVLIIPEPSLHD